MKKNRFQPIITPLFAILIPLGIYFASNSTTLARALQLTATPTVDSGMFITVITEEPQINVRMGPSSSIYPIVGKLLTGSTAPALGRSQGGDWIQIAFEGAPNGLGWVYSPLVRVSAGTLRIVAPPPTPILPATSTIDPTLAAQFNIVPTSTRLPTFTPPASLPTLSYTESPTVENSVSVPQAAIIIVLLVLGSMGFLLSIFLRR